MMGISNDAWMASGTIIGGLGTVAVPVCGWIISVIRARHLSEVTAMKDSCRGDIERIDASLKKSWEQVDDLRFNTVRKQDQDRLRDEFRSDVKALGDRLESAINDLRNDIHRDNGRNTA